jgi:hypothetical protein
LLGPHALDGAPLEETVDRHDAAPLSIGFPEHGQLGDVLRLGIDGPAATLRVAAPVWDQAPLDQVERSLACLVVLPNDQQLLAGRSIVAGANVAHAAITDIEALDDGEAKRT